MITLLGIFRLPQASTIAPAVDLLYDFIFWLSMISFIGVVGFMLFCIWRYHRSRRDPNTTPYLKGHTPLETSVAAILFVVTMLIFAWGWVDYVKMRTAPKDAMEVNVIGRQWLWEFEYTNGRKMINELVVPAKKPVKLIMSSADVLHSFFVPSFRVKQDLIPGMYTTLWFQSDDPGEYKVFCAEYCGTSHSGMIAKLRVVDEAEYTRWQRIWEFTQQLGEPTAHAATTPVGAGLKPAPTTTAEQGKLLFTQKACNTCHTIDGKPLVGPTLLGVFGHDVELTDGKKVKVDENYLRESLMDPAVKVVKGFPPVMPTYRGQLTDDEVNALVGYIKGLGKD